MGWAIYIACQNHYPFFLIRRSRAKINLISKKSLFPRFSHNSLPSNRLQCDLYSFFYTCQCTYAVGKHINFLCALWIKDGLFKCGLAYQITYLVTKNTLIYFCEFWVRKHTNVTFLLLASYFKCIYGLGCIIIVVYTWYNSILNYSSTLF